jgi:uncharacterized membrane protein
MKSALTVCENPLATSQMNEKTGVHVHSSELELQPTTQEGSTKDEIQTSAVETEDKAPERLSQKLARVRASTWWFVGALLIAIPVSIFATVFSTINISGIKITGVIIRSEILWTAA